MTFFFKKDKLCVEYIYVPFYHKSSRFVDWVALGSIDLEHHIEQTCTDPDDWERNFRASKARGQDIGRLPSGEERIECVSVSFAPVRTEVEILNR